MSGLGGDVHRNRRLVLWGTLVALLAALAYADRAASGKPDPNILYHWTIAVGSVIQDGILLVLVLWIASFRFDLLGIAPPVSVARAARLLGVALVVTYVFEIAYNALGHPGNEQGLTPSHWEPRHATAYVVNAVIICTFIPLVEELTYRGLGYSLLERFGRWPAIFLVGLVFGLAHGLVVSLPVIVAFGCVLAWVRSETRSVFPGMVLHAAFNLVALIAAVTVGN